MADVIKDNGKIIFNMEKEPFLIQQLKRINSGLVNGKTASVFSGQMIKAIVANFPKVQKAPLITKSFKFDHN